MTNEETALKIQDGENLYEQLWENNRGIISKLAFRFYRNHERACSSIGVELNDLIQCGFFALCDAAKAYNPDKGYMFCYLHKSARPKPFQGMYWHTLNQT